MGVMMKISERKLRLVIREALQKRLLNEEEYDRLRDLKAGGLSREEYEDASDMAQSDPRGKTPSDGAAGERLRKARVQPAPQGSGMDVAKTKIKQAMKDAGLHSALHDYSGMKDYLTKGYKQHPEYAGADWDRAAQKLERVLEKLLD